MHTRRNKSQSFLQLFSWLTVSLLIWLYPFTSMGQQLDEPDSSLNSYLQQAAQNNPGLQAEYQQYLAGLEQVPQVTTLPDPEVSFGYFINPIETRVGPQQARFGLTQMFPWFGTLGSRGNVATQKAKAAFEAFRESRNSLFFEVHKTWYNLYEIEESIRIIQENIDILETYESIATSRYETGEVSQADILLVQIEKEDLRTKLALMKDNREVATQKFRELLNEESMADIQLPDTLRAREQTLSVPELEQSVIQRNPQLNKFSHLAESAEYGIEVARKEGLPNFGVGFDYIITDKRSIALADNGQDALMIRAGLQIPLYRKKYRAKEKQARIQLQSVEHRQAATRNQLQTRLAEALRNYEDAQRRLSLYEDIQLQRTSQAINVLTEEYANGETDFEELLRLQRKLLNYQLARAEAIVDNNTAVAQIEYLYGKYNVNPEEIKPQ